MQFQSYRVVHKIHLGGIELVLEVGSIVQFNGSTLKTEDGEEIKLSQPSAIAGAIKVGWLVPVASKETTFIPKSAGVQVHSAKSTGEKREQVNLMTVHDEEQNVGNRQDIRRNVNAASAPARNSSEGEGVVVSRIKTSAKFAPIEIGTGDRAALAEIENQTLPVERVRVAKHTGDVSEALAGDELEDILPDAISYRPPAPSAFKDEGIQTGSGASRVGGQEDGVVIGRVGAPRPTATPVRTAPVQTVPVQEEEEESLLPEDPGFREKALRRWAQTGKTWNGQPVSHLDLSLMALSVLDSLENLRNSKVASPAAAPVLQVASVAPPAPVKAAASGEFQWDMTPHWKTRQVSLMKYKDDPETLKVIYAIENSGGVKKMIESMLEKLG